MQINILIEEKRKSNNIIWKIIIFLKDLAWVTLELIKGNFYKKNILTFVKDNYNINFKSLKNTLENPIINNQNLVNVFDQIYIKNIWTYGSGEGSLPEKTIEYRDFLQNFIKTNKIKSVLDAGCGDWQFSKLINWSKINYIGFDIVPSIIKENINNYSKKNIRFYQKDFLLCKLPKTDLVIIKDVLQHLTNENIINFLPKLNKFKFVLLINDFGKENIDCQNGDFRTLNLTNPPFNINAKEVFFFNNKQVLLFRPPA